MNPHIMSSASWAPNETPAQLWFERIYLAGLFIGAVGFGMILFSKFRSSLCCVFKLFSPGVHATLFFSTFKLLYARRQYRREQVFLGYIVIVFLLSNIGNGTNIKTAQQVFIDNRGLSILILFSVLISNVYNTTRLSWWPRSICCGAKHCAYIRIV